MENNHYITRSEAMEVLETLIDSEILDESVCDALADIMHCIDGENRNLFLWGVEQGEVEELFYVYQAETLKRKFDHLSAIYEKYKIREIVPEEDDDGADNCQ